MVARMIGLAAAACLPLALGACGTRVVADEPTAVYSRSEVGYGFGDRDARVRVIGNPFPVPKPVLERTVTDAMQNKALGIRTHFTTTPDDTARPDYWVVMAFNPARDVLAARLCGAETLATAPPDGGPVVVEAAVCRPGAMTSATGWIDEVTGVDDPRFRQLIGDLTFALFPIRRTQDDNDDSCFLGC